MLVIYDIMGYTPVSDIPKKYRQAVDLCWWGGFTTTNENYLYDDYQYDENQKKIKTIDLTGIPVWEIDQKRNPKEKAISWLKKHPEFSGAVVYWYENNLGEQSGIILQNIKQSDSRIKIITED